MKGNWERKGAVCVDVPFPREFVFVYECIYLLRIIFSNILDNVNNEARNTEKRVGKRK